MRYYPVRPSAGVPGIYLLPRVKNLVTPKKLRSNCFFASDGNDGKGSCGQIHTYIGDFHNPQAQTDDACLSYEMSRHTMNIV